MFAVAVKGGWQGITYLMLDNGFDYLLAMQVMNLPVFQPDLFNRYLLLFFIFV